VTQIKTLRDIYDNDLAFEAHCMTCLRFVAVDLEEMIAEGKGDRSCIGKKPTCQRCGQKGEWQIRPKGTAVGTG
jgi:hypothetical protein